MYIRIFDLEVVHEAAIVLNEQFLWGLVALATWPISFHSKI